MPLFICTACGTQYPESAQVPAHCVICEEERQYVPPRGQTWTTLQTLRQTHTNTFREYEKGLIGIGSTPSVASLSFTACVPSACTVSWWSFATMSRGVLAGANKPTQKSKSELA